MVTHDYFFLKWVETHLNQIGVEKNCVLHLGWTNIWLTCLHLTAGHMEDVKFPNSLVPFQEATLGVQRFRLAAAGQELSVSLGGRRHRLVFFWLQPAGIGGPKRSFPRSLPFGSWCLEEQDRRLGASIKNPYVVWSQGHLATSSIHRNVRFWVEV